MVASGWRSPRTFSEGHPFWSCPTHCSEPVIADNYSRTFPFQGTTDVTDHLTTFYGTIPPDDLYTRTRLPFACLRCHEFCYACNFLMTIYTCDMDMYPSSCYTYLILTGTRTRYGIQAGTWNIIYTLRYIRYNCIDIVYRIEL